MRKKFVVAVVTVLFLGGAAAAQADHQPGRPETDPSCHAQSDRCPGDNGTENGDAEQGTATACEESGGNGGLELAQDIVFPEDEAPACPE